MGRKPLNVASPLTAQQALFVAEFIESGDKKAALYAAGYSDACPQKELWRLLKSPHIARAIAAAVRQRFVELAPLAVRVLENVVRDERMSDRVRVDAAKTLLDRAGYVPPKAQAEKSTDLPLNEMSTDELRGLAAKLDDEIAGRAKPISALPAPETHRVDALDVDLLE